MIEEQLKRIADALENIHAEIGNPVPQAKTTRAAAVKTEEPKKKKRGRPPKKTEMVVLEEKNVEAITEALGEKIKLSNITREQLVTAAKPFVKKHGGPGLSKLLGTFDAKKFDEVKQEDRAELVRALREV